MPEQLSLVERFLNYLLEVRHLSSITFKLYEIDLTQFYSFLQGKTAEEVDSLILLADESTIERYLANLQSLSYASGTINRRVAALRSFYKWLVLIKAVTRNPTLKLRFPKRPPRPVKMITADQITELLAMPDNTIMLGARDLALLEIMISTCARVSELVELDQDAVDLNSETPCLYLKGKKARVVTLGVGAHAALLRYLAFRSQMSTTSTFLFLNKHGRRLSSRSVRRKLDKYLAMAGIDPEINPYTLRHTCAQRLIGDGVDVGEVQKLLGHNQRATTHHAYAGFLNGVQPAVS